MKAALPALAEIDVVLSGSACIVADLDNDGFVDVLRPRAADGCLWKGSAKGFNAPATASVFCKGGGRVAVGDFNEDGFLDVFTCGADAAELWENDGHAAFRPVSAAAGSLSYKMTAGVSECRAVDLNHDGRPDLCLLYADKEFACHFNRGFRCFGEEGELRLPGGEAERNAPGQRAAAIADFNGDGSLDLAVAFSSGRVACFYNGLFNKPTLRVALKRGQPGPVTVSAWQGDKPPVCVGTLPVAAWPARTRFTVHDDRDVTLQWRLPGKPPSSRIVKIPSEGREGGVAVIIGE